MCRVFFIVCFLFVSSLYADGFFESLLTSETFSMSKGVFESKLQKEGVLCAWNSKYKKTLRYHYVESSKASYKNVLVRRKNKYGKMVAKWEKRKVLGKKSAAVEVYGHPVMEAVFNFSKIGLAHYNLSLYNSGDAKEGVPVGELMAKTVTPLKSKLNVHFQQKARRLEEKGDASKVSYQWVRPEATYSLDYIIKYGNVTYLSLVAHSSQEKRLPFANKLAALRKNLNRDGQGAFIDNFPMVNQGAKGYCACATIARIMSYYGKYRDMHEIASLSNTDASRGTNIEELEQGMSAIRAVLKADYKVLYTITSSGAKKIQRKARSMEKRHYSKDEWENKFVGFLEKTVEFKKFKSDVKANVNKAAPLAWAVMLGIFPEKKAPQASGGHMRIIIGYDSEGVIYTDSWGLGHEREPMSWVKAFFITRLLARVQPRS